MKQFIAFKSGLDYGQHKVQDAGVVGTELAAQPDDLADGAIGLFAIANTGKLKFINAAADFADVKEFIVARGRGNGVDGTPLGPLLSDTITRKQFNIEKVGVVAGVAEVITLGGASNSLVGGSVSTSDTATVGVTIVDTSKTRISDRRPYNFEVKAKGLDAKGAADALVVKINKANIFVTASATGTGATGALVLTHKKKGVQFDAHGAVGSNSETSSKANTTAPVKASGDYATLKATALECEGYQGRTNYVDATTMPLGNSATLDAAIDTYVTYGIRTVTKHQRVGVPTATEASRLKRLTLAIPQGTAAITTLDTLLTAAAMEEVSGQAEEIGG